MKTLRDLIDRCYRYEQACAKKQIENTARSLILVFFLIFLVSGFAQQDFSREKGKIIDSILTSGKENESFALYLPTQFDSKRPSAIVFISDPAARGKVGITPFVPASEKFNYILVCSNNSKNGPYATNLDVTDRLFKHIFARFNIDAKRIYTAGFSGGSRLATSIAVLSKAIQGVIGCGAGFPGTALHRPSNDDDFAYVGLVGDRDMNYSEMHKVQEYLDAMEIDNALFTYEDDHKWPPPEQLLRAFGWLELQAYNRGLKPINTQFIQEIFAQDYAVAKSFEKEMQLLKAVREYGRIVKNYSKYYELDSLQGKMKGLKKNKYYRTQNRDYKKAVQLEDSLSIKFSRRFYEEVSVGRSKDNFKWWKNQLEKLKRSYADNDSEQLQKMEKRLQYKIFAMAIETFDARVREKAKNSAVYCAELLLIQDPTNPFFHYRISRGFAQLNLVEQSLLHLEKALINGWKDLELIKRSKDFDPIRGYKKFEDLVDPKR